MVNGAAPADTEPGPGRGLGPAAIGSPPGGPVRRHLSDLRVAAALARRPFGVRSARSLARAAGVSPTTVAVALRRLQRDGVVTRRVDEVAEGRVLTVAVWTIDWRSPAWLGLAAEAGRLRAGEPAPVLARAAATAPAAAPAPPTAAADRTGRACRSRRVPSRLAHLFWNADLAGVDTGAHGPYVAARILRADDCQALGWLARTLHPEAIRAAAGGRGLDPSRAALAHLLAGA